MPIIPACMLVIIHEFTLIGPYGRRELSSGSQSHINNSELLSRCSFNMMPIQRVHTYIHTHSYSINMYIHKYTRAYIHTYSKYPFSGYTHTYIHTLYINTQYINTYVFFIKVYINTYIHTCI